ncbi:MAG: chitobiase/beta-hexosaminidase C-terminal domain-containing protein [Lachnospiraceae bacterium]|nr:chitobiase/beta-hexosaminidase C-terminal domain-containing protein [Lachnospiraceae bacterium]
MYCPKCGHSIQIVPDYDPEIEENILKSGEDISDSLEALFTPEGERRVSEDTVELPAVNEKVKFIRRTSLVTGILFVLIAAAVLGGLSVVEIRRTSFNGIITRAEEAYSDGEYENAAKLYSQALDKQLEDAPLFERVNLEMKLAETWRLAGDRERALAVYETVIGQDSGNTDAYLALVELYYENEDYGMLDRTISSITDEAVRDRLSSYLTGEVEFSVKSGSYDREFDLELSSDKMGSIYYTLDGTDPTVNSEEYAAPIRIGEGESTVRAVFVNIHGIAGSVREERYEVSFAVPDAPVVTPDSGQYSIPEYIIVDVPDGVNAYYTTDGSDPDADSELYGKALTMELGKSTLKFVYISDKGVASPVSEVNYSLNIVGNCTPEDAVNYLIYSLATTGELLDLFGNAPGGKHFSFVCNRAAREGSRTYYIIDEYEDSSGGTKTLTENTYAMDVTGLQLYRAEENADGKYRFKLFY